MKDILDPAIRLAEEGIPVQELAWVDNFQRPFEFILTWSSLYSSNLWRGGEKKLKSASPNGAELLCSNGKAPEVGQIFQNPTLAQTFREIGEKGKKGFYEGRVAQAIVDGAW